MNWIYTESLIKIGQEQYDLRGFEGNLNLTMTLYRFSWSGDLTFGHIDLFFENVYKGCPIGYINFDDAARHRFFFFFFFFLHHKTSGMVAYSPAGRGLGAVKAHNWWVLSTVNTIIRPGQAMKAWWHQQAASHAWLAA